MVLFFDGEMHGAERYLRCSSRFLWGISLLVFLVQVVAAIALLAIEPMKLAIQRGSPVQAIALVFGP